MIRLDHVSKEYGRESPAVRDVSFEVADGEFVVLVGPSGSGKSTILKMIAGLSRATEGRIFIAGIDVTSLPPQERDVAVVFQNYALYPHMTVRRNLEFGLKMRKTPVEERRKRVADVAAMLGLNDLLERNPSALSGGERQRVAMGRAIVRRPKAFLLDEPLSNLDALLRVQVRADLLQLRERLRTTTIYVTHDQVEAMTLGERIAVLRDGELQQLDTARQLYGRPANAFVASFIGSPPMNVFRGLVDGSRIKIGSQWIPVNAGSGIRRWDGRELLIGIRPSAFESADFCRDPWPRLTVTVRGLEELGSETIVLFSAIAPTAEDSGGVAAIQNAAESELRFQARVDARVQAKIGAQLTLALDPDAVYFFDPDSGETISHPRQRSTSAEVTG